MCGIAGIVNRESHGGIDRMIDIMHYRGPDGRGSKITNDGSVSLGHCRLSIIDPHPSGAQPMSTDDDRFHIVFNGEIYNYIEIRSLLETKGIRFRSNSDTEVLLNAFLYWGKNCLGQFIGMFAFAIWDSEKKELFAARDRLGKKPFYFAVGEQSLVFASEIKAILTVEGDSHGVDETLIDAYMSFGYVPGDKTLHAGIRRLLPGNYLVWSANRVDVCQYWDFDFDNKEDRGLGSYTEKLESLLDSSISLRLRSDVPLGVFLSGGLDSSAVVSLLSPGAASGLNTFSVAYDFGPEYDETSYAREVASRFNTEHHEIYISPRDFMEFLPKFVWHMDEPVTEAAAISLYYVSRLARENVVVCLSGEGSDELFAGYDFYAYNLAIESARKLMGNSLINSFAAIGRKLSLARKLQKYLEMARFQLETRYKGISSYEESRKSSLYSSAFKATAQEGNCGLKTFVAGLFDRSRSWDPLSRLLYFDTKTWLVDDLLIKADRMSMAASVELRVPFLDHRVVEYAATIPSRYKLNGLTPKFILKQIVKDRLPQRIVDRKKMGFPTPLENMLKQDLFDYAYETLLSTRSLQRGYFDRGALELLLINHKNGKEQNHREIFQLVVLEEWHRQFNH
jgi:asparagine synthase (glutamine-hydrolysing)